MRTLGATLVIIVLTIAVACTDKDKVPSGIIPKVEMEKILWDMIQADQYSMTYLIKDSAHVNVKMETLKLYQQVFQLHKVSREEFRESYQYYLGRPDLTRPLFDSLLAKGNRLRQESYRNPPVSTVPVVQPPVVQAPVTKPPAPQVKPPVLPAGTKGSATSPAVNRIIPSKPGKPGNFPKKLHDSVSRGGVKQIN